MMDCQAVKTSLQPYELQMRVQNAQSYPVQVFRRADLVRMQYTQLGNQVITSKFQGNFHLETRSSGGIDVLFRYSAPTDRYVWQQDSRIVTYNTIISGNATEGPGFTQVYEMFADEVMPVGNCSFAVKHFRYKQSTAEKTSNEEVWFSPELNAQLHIIEVTTLPSGETKRRELTAVGITTEFKPML